MEWLKTKIYLDTQSGKAKHRIVKRGQVYRCNFGINIGSEMSKKTPRPCVILQNDIGNMKSSNTVIVTVTHDKAKDSFLVPIMPRTDLAGKTILDGKVNVTNIICISKARLADPVGNPIVVLSKKEMDRIDLELAKNLALIHYYNDIKKRFDDRLNCIDRIKSDRNKAQDIISNIQNEINSEHDRNLMVKIFVIYLTIDNWRSTIVITKRFYIGVCGILHGIMHILLSQSGLA